MTFVSPLSVKMRGWSLFVLLLVVISCRSSGAEMHDDDEGTETCSAAVFGECLANEFLQLRKAIRGINDKMEILTSTYIPLFLKWFLENGDIKYTGDINLESCQAYVDNGQSQGDGWYVVKPAGHGNAFPVYCDQTTLGGGWMRLYYKQGSRTCFKNPQIKWTEALLASFNFSDFAVSDKIETLTSEGSWLLLSHTGMEILYLPEELTILDVLANLANCLTPSGNVWSDGFAGGYFYVKGRLSTMGSWTTMFHGCQAWRNVGDDTTFRSGGRTNHEGEFIHTACNNYNANQATGNRLTSRWNWDNTRTIWIR